MFILYFDGLFRPIHKSANGATGEGFVGFGWVIYQDGVIIARGYGLFAHHNKATSGIAEYLALIEGLDALLDLCKSADVVEIRGDARFVIDQMNGQSKVSSSQILPFYQRASGIAHKFDQVRWLWTPRKNNREADALSRRALRLAQPNIQRYKGELEAQRAQAGWQKYDNKLHSLVDLRVYHLNPSAQGFAVNI